MFILPCGDCISFALSLLVGILMVLEITPLFRVKRYQNRSCPYDESSSAAVSAVSDGHCVAADIFSAACDSEPVNLDDVAETVASPSGAFEHATGCHFVAPSAKAKPARVTVNRWDGPGLASGYKSRHSKIEPGLEVRNTSLPSSSSSSMATVGLGPVGTPKPLPIIRTKKSFPGMQGVFRSPSAVGSTSVNVVKFPGSLVHSSVSATHPLPVRAVVPKLAQPVRFQSMSDAFAKAKSIQLDRWVHLIQTAKSCSSVYRDLVSSPMFDEHCKHIISSFAPSTMDKYLHIWDVWQSHAGLCSCSSFDPAATVLADFLHHHSKGSLGSALHWWKGLHWVAKHAGFDGLCATLQSPVVKSYTKVTNHVERRESTPFMLSFVVMLEQAILTGNISNADALRFGALLICIWASLRWADAQWVKPGDLQIHQQSLLGHAIRTKTTKRSMPFGVFVGGFLSRPGRPNWVSKWFPVMLQALAHTRQLYPQFEPDFLIAELGDDPNRPLFLAPMSRSRGVTWLRHLVSDHFKKAEHPLSQETLQLVGVHSAKTTMLAWSRQLSLDEESRRLQGHHRSSSAAASVQLYARDDVFPALKLQETVSQRVALGFRPICAVMRGGAPPVVDIDVVVPPWPQDVASVLEAPPLQASQVIEDMVQNPDIDTSSSSDTDSDEALSNADERESLGMPDELSMLYNPMSSVLHVALSCLPDDPRCVMHDDQCFKTACGSRLTALDGGLILTTAVPAASRMCSKFGCAKIFNDMSTV